MDKKKISEHSFAESLDDGRVLILSNSEPGIGTYDRIWRASTKNWEVLPQSYGNIQIIPFGWQNDIPTFIRDVVDENNLVPGIINRQFGLLWGQGPHLYREEFIDGQISRHWLEDPEISRWLESWDFKSYLRGCLTDYLHLGGFFDAWYLQRGHRIGITAKIAALEHLPAKNSRLEWPENDGRTLSDVSHIVLGDFENGCVGSGITVYPIVDAKDPARYPAAAAYHRKEPFSRDFYAVSPFWGALRWIIRGSEIPTIFKYVTENGINLAYHVHSPDGYWEMRRQALQRLHEDWTPAQIEAEIGNITKKMLDNMVSVLTGKENAGKLFHSIDIIDDQGNSHSWKVEPIDQKIKDFVESQLKISEASVSAITSGMGLHPSLSNIMVNGKLASGSEMLYAFKLFLMSDTEMISDILFESVNRAIAFNYSDRKVKLGFYHQSVKTEESLSASDRLKNS